MRQVADAESSRSATQVVFLTECRGTGEQLCERENNYASGRRNFGEGSINGSVTRVMDWNYSAPFCGTEHAGQKPMF